MFGWFKRRATSAADAQMQPAETTETKPAAVPAGAARPTPEPLPAASRPAPLPPSTTRGQNIPSAAPVAAEKRAGAKGRHAKAGKKDPSLPVDHRDPPPKVGMPAVEVSGGRRRAGVVTLVHAEGRYVVARLAGIGAGRTYTRTADGTYRLAGRVVDEPPRLVLGVR